MRISLFLVVLCCTTFLRGQGVTIISGSIKDAATKNLVQNVVIKIDGSSKEFFTDSEGYFEVKTSSTGEKYLKISALDFVSKQFMVTLNGEPIDLGDIFLEKDITLEKTANLITLTDNDLAEDDAAVSGSSGLLQSTKDIFLNRAAFDFGQAFFRVRGYDSSYGEVLLNGIPMNKFFAGRPQWNNWGGLNDVIRNQEFSSGLAPNRYTFGGFLWNTNINTIPSQLRPGIRLSSSASNRTYKGRLMAT